LVTAPSNVAVDNVLARLVVPPTIAATKKTKGGSGSSGKKRSNHHRLKVVRLGHPARLQAAILPYSLEALVQSADGTEIVGKFDRVYCWMEAN